MAILAQVDVAQLDPARDSAPVDPCPQGAAEIDLRAFLSVSNREEAEQLLMLDRLNTTTDTTWTAFFVELMVGFLVWQHEPWGVIAEADLDWLLGHVADAPTPSTPALLFALVREVNNAPERLLRLAMKLPRNRLAAG
ncbi:MAG: hypothetical protein LDL25_01830 [Hyphomicrobiales bacterium]|uniref:hypothetical protein n=1 Tax=Rhabdaerophilum calidifontis TaxID=2604328 RepID=UPI0012385323|nr:hypothetical protein [Rhabdaerophilum calidifontis]MCA1952794.1 hypothetical protein [Hyphomicrobiales bacterium]MCA1998506.1 hypothetical protein [Hyphomicrobiales bacterium]